jgi:hypothetical protein
MSYDQKNFFRENYQYGYQKTQNFMLIYNSLKPAFKNATNKLEAKNHECEKTKILKIRIVFGCSFF